MYTPSVNLEYTSFDDFEYIITPNAKAVYNEITYRFVSGVHSFTIIGNYGTGKSSFLLELKKELLSNNIQDLVTSKAVFNNSNDFVFLNVIGEYAPLVNLLEDKLQLASYGKAKNVLNALDSYYTELQKKHKFLVICIDEFGKVLEHAANYPDTEPYFIQQLTEYVNASDKNIILLTTLHQNFNTYAWKLNESQRNEWSKVKGRFCDIIFHEPLEQLLFLAAKKMGENEENLLALEQRTILYDTAIKSKIVSNINMKTINELYPLEPFSAMALTTAIQRYGQNERSLFSFLSSSGTGSLKDFKQKNNRLFNLSDVYDYIVYNFYSALSTVNSDTTNWSALQEAIERTKSGVIEDELIKDALHIVKSIGLINIFASGESKLDKDTLKDYCINALSITNDSIIDKLVAAKIIRFAKYKSKYIIFDGTDVDIEGELYKASSIIPKPNVSKEEIQPYFKEQISEATAYYYNTGCPRYFQYIITDGLLDEDVQPSGQTDGFICFIFPKTKDDEISIFESSREDSRAIIYVVFKNTEKIQTHLWEIKKLNYILENIDEADRIAKRELDNQLAYEKDFLNNIINSSILNSNVTEWIYKGEEKDITSYQKLNQQLSSICKNVYSKTPIVKCEMLNKEKVSVSISTARKNLLEKLLNNSSEKNLGFNFDKFPPERTIFEILLKENGMYRENSHDFWELCKPNTSNLADLWEQCEHFLNSTIEKPRKLDELVNILRRAPFKLKQGLLDFWMPIFLLVEQSKYALFYEKKYVPVINKEVLDILQKSTNGYTIKVFDQTGIKKELFNKYRDFLKKNNSTVIDRKVFNNTYNQFFIFYNHLNTYAKNTRKFDHVTTEKFRDVLAKASDPEKALFIDIPKSLELSNTTIEYDEDTCNQFISRLRQSVHELIICYDEFIDRIEQHVIVQLGLSNDFNTYKDELNNRYSSVKTYLLSSKARVFHERIMSPSKSKKDFYECIGSIVYDKSLDNIMDNEEEYLIDNIVYLFRELDRCVEISKYDESKNQIYNIELASSSGLHIKQKTFVFSNAKNKEVADMEHKIEKFISENTEIGTCAMLKLLSKFIKKD